MKIHKYMRLALVALAILLPISVNASGTLYLSDIEPLLKQQLELWGVIKSAFDVEEVGIASRINSKENPKLGGERTGPYAFSAKPKGENGPFIFSIEIQAKVQFLDAKGKEVPIEKASRVKETFDSIVIQKRPQSEIDEEIRLRRLD